jgi:hypothetical protein
MAYYNDDQLYRYFDKAIQRESKHKIEGLIKEIDYLYAKEIKKITNQIIQNLDSLKAKRNANSKAKPDAEIIEKMKECKLDTNNRLLVDICNRDFTINMMAYNVVSGSVYDPLNVAEKDIKARTVRTFFNPYFVLENNPFVILRAIKLHLQLNYVIDKRLHKAMLQFAPLLKDRYSKGKLLFAIESIMDECPANAEQVLKRYGLDKIGE